jgi:energy-coupling factor transporter ATP-binding protein EcfA2
MGADLPLIGLVKERRRLLDALRNRDSLLVLGPRGSGKTAVIRSVIQDLPSKSGIIYVEYSSTLHELLISLTRTLLKSGHQNLRRRAAAGADPEAWLSRQTSIHLKGILWSSLEEEPRTLILDGVDGASHPAYRFLQRLYFGPGMAVYAASRNVIALGALGRLFWDPRKTLQFQPLSESDAGQLFELAADRAGLRMRGLNLEEFREKVLDAAGGNPGQIIEMCQLAADPQYASGSYIKFAPLRIDALMKFMG